MTALPQSIPPRCAGESTTPIVPSNLFGEVPVPPPVQVAYTPAANDATARVSAVAQRLQAKNPQLSIHPVVLTSAQPHPDISHQGETQIIITEGLVRQCQTEEQLAAVLGLELGKILAERAAAASDRTRKPDRPLPIDIHVGNDNSGVTGSEMVHQVELAKYEEERAGSQRNGPIQKRVPVIF